MMSNFKKLFIILFINSNKTKKPIFSNRLKLLFHNGLCLSERRDLNPRPLEPHLFHYFILFVYNAISNIILYLKRLLPPKTVQKLFIKIIN